MGNVSVLLVGAILALGALGWVLVSKQMAVASAQQRKAAEDKRRKLSRAKPAEVEAETKKRPRNRDFGRR